MMNKPNILLVVPRLNIGGAESYVFTLATGLKQRGYYVVVTSWGGHLANVLVKQGIPHYLIPIRLNSYLASLMLELVIKKEKINLVHANACGAGTASFPVCERLNLPWILTAHGVFGRETKNLVLKYANRIICVSNFLREELKTRTDIEKNKLVTIYNGINLNQFKPQGISLSLRKCWGFKETDFVIGIVSRIWELNTKGHDDLLQIMASYSQAKNWKLLIVGKGKALPALKRRVRQLKLLKRVVFAGHQRDVPKVLEAIDVLGFPSSYETFGLAAAEAMAMARPVVAYEVGGIPEVVRQGITGFLVPNRDVDGLAENLNRLYLNREMAVDMGLKGRQVAEELFDSEQMINEITALYEQVLGEQGEERG